MFQRKKQLFRKKPDVPSFYNKQLAMELYDVSAPKKDIFAGNRPCHHPKIQYTRYNVPVPHAESERKLSDTTTNLQQRVSAFPARLHTSGILPINKQKKARIILKPIRNPPTSQNCSLFRQIVTHSSKWSVGAETKSNQPFSQHLRIQYYQVFNVQPLIPCEGSVSSGFRMVGVLRIISHIE